MAEGTNMIEAEIAQLTAAIQEKRAQLERERGSSVESNEALHTVVAEKINQQMPPAPPVATQGKPTSSGKSYLDDLDPADVIKVNELIDLVPSLGISKVVAKAKEEIPFVLDAFHDALVDKLHDELRRQKLI